MAADLALSRLPPAGIDSTDFIADCAAVGVPHGPTDLDQATVARLANTKALSSLIIILDY